MTGPLELLADGVRLAVRATPRARRSEARGVVDVGDGRRALSVRLAASPVEGAANDALIAFLADAAGVARSAVTIVSGEKARLKRVEISGDPKAIATRLAALLGSSHEPPKRA